MHFDEKSETKNQISGIEQLANQVTDKCLNDTTKKLKYLENIQNQLLEVDLRNEELFQQLNQTDEYVLF